MTNCTENQKHVFAGILSAMHPFNLSPPSPTRPLLAGILSAFNVSLVQASCFLALPHQTQAYTLLTGNDSRCQSLKLPQGSPCNCSYH